MDLKKHRWLWMLCTAAYLTALCLLTIAERSAPDASIQTFADAFWYSLVTMSTVGYGDLYPVTPLGRILGTGFILLSLGLLTFLFSFLIRIVSGSMLPTIQLWRVRKKTWYIFSCQNSAAFALANDLAAKEPDCVLLFPLNPDCIPPEDLNHLIYNGTPESIAAKKHDRCCICYLDDTDTYGQAVAALKTGHPVYCSTAFAPDACPENLTLFDSHDCCARSYWQDHGLKPGENTILLIGGGKYAETLLSRGLLLNVYGPSRRIRYHVFGNWENFSRNHWLLAAALCPGEKSEESDQLIFHKNAWNADASLLMSADRILLCQDDPDRNVEILGQIHRYFPVKAEIHLLSPNPLPGQITFGSPDSIFTTQLVFQEQMNQAARAMHMLYSESYGTDAPGWEQLSEFLRQSNIAAAEHLLTKIRILLEDENISAITPEHCRAAYTRYCGYSPEQKELCRRIEHQRWMRFHSMYNWRYAPIRNNAAREHPLMLPYEMLSSGDQQKDDSAWELLDQMARKL